MLNDQERSAAMYVVHSSKEIPSSLVRVSITAFDVLCRLVLLTSPEMLLRLGQFIQTSSTVSNVASVNISTANYRGVSRRKTNFNYNYDFIIVGKRKLQIVSSFRKKKDIVWNAFCHFPGQTVENWKQWGKGECVFDRVVNGRVLNRSNEQVLDNGIKVG